MKIAYTVSEHRNATGEVDLDLDAEMEWEAARSDDERRAVLEAAARAHARMDGDWVYGLQVDVGVVPDVEDG